MIPRQPMERGPVKEPHQPPPKEPTLKRRLPRIMNERRPRTVDMNRLPTRTSRTRSRTLKTVIYPLQTSNQTTDRAAVQREAYTPLWHSFLSRININYGGTWRAMRASFIYIEHALFFNPVHVHKGLPSGSLFLCLIESDDEGGSCSQL